MKATTVVFSFDDGSEVRWSRQRSFHFMRRERWPCETHSAELLANQYHAKEAARPKAKPQRKALGIVSGDQEPVT